MPTGRPGSESPSITSCRTSLRPPVTWRRSGYGTKTSLSHGLEIPVHHAHRARSLAHRGGDTLPGSGTNVADGEDPRSARLEEKWVAVELPSHRLAGGSPGEVGTRQHVPLVVELHEPLDHVRV